MKKKLMNIKFSIEEIAMAIGTRKCLIFNCGRELEDGYHLPICKKHRIESLKEIDSQFTRKVKE